MPGFVERKLILLHANNKGADQTVHPHSLGSNFEHGQVANSEDRFSRDEALYKTKFNLNTI